MSDSVACCTVENGIYAFLNKHNNFHKLFKQNIPFIVWFVFSVVLFLVFIFIFILFRVFRSLFWIEAFFFVLISNLAGHNRMKLPFDLLSPIYWQTGTCLIRSRFLIYPFNQCKHERKPENVFHYEVNQKAHLMVCLHFKWDEWQLFLFIKYALIRSCFSINRFFFLWCAQLQSNL